MIDRGACTECHTIWYACRCPARCEECGAGYRDDGWGTCGTPSCQANLRRRDAIDARWARDAAGEPETNPLPVIRCEPAAEVVDKPARRAAPRPDKLVARPVAQRRADVVALLAEGLSDREIGRRANVSPSTVSAVRKAQEAAKIGA